jgi:trans-2-enoyl-CoA reductase
VAGLPRAPRLALNCVGGKSSTQLLRLIGPGGVHVTYGGMSREPVVVPTSALIFQDVHVRGFWMSEWYRTHTRADRDAILADLAAMVRQGHLHFTFQHAALDTYGAALAHAGSGNAKQIFMF